jgi:hypothetical protein
MHQLSTWIDKLPTLVLACFLTLLAIVVVSLTGGILLASSAALSLI